MTNYKEILRMKYAGFSERTIAKSLHCSRNTVSRCIRKARELGISIPVAESTTNEQLYEHLYGSRREIRDPQYHYPDFKELAEEMQKPHVTKGLLWTEYLLECKSVGLKPYSISQFNSLFRVYEQKHKLSMKGKHAPGEVLELDWSGSSLLLSNQVTDEAVACHLFVAAFPYSNYFYAEAFPNENIHSWIGGIVHCVNLFRRCSDYTSSR